MKLKENLSDGFTHYTDRVLLQGHWTGLHSMTQLGYQGSLNIFSSLYLRVDVEQHQVVSPWHHKVHPGVVGVHHFVFGPVKNRVVHWQHGRYRQNFVWTFVPGRRWRRETWNSNIETCRATQRKESNISHHPPLTRTRFSCWTPEYGLKKFSKISFIHIQQKNKMSWGWQ